MRSLINTCQRVLSTNKCEYYQAVPQELYEAFPIDRTLKYVQRQNTIKTKCGQDRIFPAPQNLLERAISGIYESSSSSRDEKCCVWAEFETCLNFDFDSDFNTALHEAILKSCKYFWILSKHLCFYFILNNSTQWISLEYHYTNVSFQSSWNSLLYWKSVSNSVNRDYKLESHSKQNKSVCRHFD